MKIEPRDIAGNFDGAAWCIIGGAGQLAPPLNAPAGFRVVGVDYKQGRVTLASMQRTRTTLDLAMKGYVVRSRSKPSLGMRMLEQELSERHRKALAALRDGCDISVDWADLYTELKEHRRECDICKAVPGLEPAP